MSKGIVIDKDSVNREPMIPTIFQEIDEAINAINPSLSDNLCSHMQLKDTKGEICKSFVCPEKVREAIKKVRGKYG